MNAVILREQDPRTKTYLGSPALLRLPDGALLAAHDYFGPGCPRNHEDEEHLTSMYRSDDGGRSWRNLCHIANAYWSSLFWCEGAAYLLGCSQQYGHIVIRRSDDGGYTWTHPSSPRTGLLRAGGPRNRPPSYHGAPVPVAFAHGRLYRAFEDNAEEKWCGGFHALALSAEQGADLLDAESWTMSQRVPFSQLRLPQTTPAYEAPGWLEGNIVPGPDGTLWNILRFHSAPHTDLALRLRLSQDGKLLWQEDDNPVVALPGGGHKFSIKPAAGGYLALVNPAGGEQMPAVFQRRNVLAAVFSRDLQNWRTVRVLLSGETGRDAAASLERTGYQYADWVQDGDDLLYLVRTANADAPRFHDANRITFHREAGFFRALAQDAIPG